MGFKEQYERAKPLLLADDSICAENRDLFRRFFEFEEYKLKRLNGLPELDNACYRTLLGYIHRFRRANTWFQNKPWKDLTREDIKRVYDALEDGIIKNRRGLPVEDRRGYYNKIFKSKPFRLVGKAELAKDVIEYSTQEKKDVRFITEDTFRRLISVVSKPHHLLLFWLAWDIGENIDALLKLTKSDFTKQINRYSNETEYLVNLPSSKIKRSRRSRTEPTLYPETVRFAEIVLDDLEDAGKLFPFGYRQALKLLHATGRKTRATALPLNDRVKWKDFRSGMACHLLRSGWTSDEVNARLGHAPHSAVLDAYINYLALDKEKPKRRLHDSSLEAVQRDLEEARRRERLAGERLQREEQDSGQMKAELEQTRRDLAELRAMIERVLRQRPVGTGEASSMPLAIIGDGRRGDVRREAGEVAGGDRAAA